MKKKHPKEQSLSLLEWGSVFSFLCLVVSFLAISWMNRSKTFEESAFPKKFGESREIISLQIEGWVEHPGTYEFFAGVLLEEVLQKVGVKEGANLSSLSPSYWESESLYIPQKCFLRFFLSGAVKNPGKRKVYQGTRLCDLESSIEYEEGADRKFLHKRRKIKEGEVLCVPYWKK